MSVFVCQYSLKVETLPLPHPSSPLPLSHMCQPPLCRVCVYKWSSLEAIKPRLEWGWESRNSSTNSKVIRCHKLTHFNFCRTHTHTHHNKHTWSKSGGTPGYTRLPFQPLLSYRLQSIEWRQQSCNERLSEMFKGQGELEICDIRTLSHGPGIWGRCVIYNLNQNDCCS